MTIGFRILTRSRTAPKALVESFARLPVANVSDCMSRMSAGGTALRPMHASGGMASVALTVKTRPGDNLMLHKAIDMAEPGDVIVVALLFLTGLRANEVLAMPWSEVGEDSITIGAPRMKAGEPLTRPITVAMRRVFRHQKTFHPHSPWVFPARSGDGPMRDLRKALWPLNESVLGDLRAIILHDLRRTFIATAALAAAPPIATKMLVGHATTDVTEEYAKALRSELPGITARIEGELLREVAS